MTDKKKISRCDNCEHELILFNGSWVHCLRIQSDVQQSGQSYPLVHKTPNCLHEVDGKQCRCRTPILRPDKEKPSKKQGGGKH